MILTKEQILAAIPGKKNVQEIADEFGISKNVLKTCFARLDIFDHPVYKKFLDDQRKWKRKGLEEVKLTVDMVIDALPGKTTLQEVADALKVNRSYLVKHMGLLGVREHSKYQDFARYNRSRCKSKIGNPSFFFKDSPELWYMIGYLLGDGWLGARGHTIHWSSTDKHIVEDFSKVIRWEGGFRVNKPQEREIKGKIYNTRAVYVLSLSDTEIHEKLRDLGIPYKKSHNRSHCVIPPKGFEPDFLRGLLD